MLDWDAMMATVSEVDNERAAPSASGIGEISPTGGNANDIQGKCEAAPIGSLQPLSHVSHISPAKVAWVEVAKDDDRRRCVDCANRNGQGYCLAAQRGEVIAARGYTPIADLLRRCEGYKPLPGESDQRNGRERWPGLCSTETDAPGVAR